MNEAERVSRHREKCWTTPRFFFLLFLKKKESLASDLLFPNSIEVVVTFAGTAVGVSIGGERQLSGIIWC